MVSWLRVVGLVKIFLAEWLAMFLLATCFGQLVAARGARGCPPDGVPIDWSFYVALLLGLLAAGWLLYRILLPVEVEESYAPPLAVGPVAVPNPGVAPVRLKFCSTHPVYVLVDALAVGGALLLLSTAPDTMGCSLLSQWASARAALLIALFFPMVRLLSWYPLGRRASPAARAGVVKPILVLYAILLAPAALWGHLALKDRRARARAPVVDATTFRGGLRLHPEFLGKVVHVLGVRKLDAAARCGCRGPGKDDCDYAEVLLDLGAGGEVVAQARASEVMFLLKKSEGRRGQPDDAFGRLSPLPHPEKKLCGAGSYGPAPPAGRALLEIEYP